MERAMQREPDQSAEATRPVPWLTYALVAACLCAFAFSEKAAIEVEAALGTEFASANEFLRDHAHLETPPLLAQHLSSETAAALANEKRAARGSHGVLSRLIAREQAELDALVVTAAARVGQLPARIYGLRAAEPAWRTIATHPFLHGGWLHLASNLLLLVLLGYYLEGAYRLGGFALVAGTGVVCSAFAFASFNPGYVEPLIGFGGLLAGLLGAFAVRFRGARDEVPYGVVLALTPVALALPVFLGYEWAIDRAIGSAPALSGVLNPSIASLVGGLAGGFVAAVFALLVGLERRPAGGEAPPAERASVVDPQFLRALELQKSGQLDEAFNLLTGILRRLPEDLDASVALWRVANQLGRPRAASSAILRVIREQVKRGETDDTVQHWIELSACELESAADTALLLRMVPLLRENERPVEVVRALRAALESSVDGTSAAPVAARVAQEAADLDPQLARDAAWRAMGSSELSLEERHDLECLLSVIAPNALDDAEPVEPSATISDSDLMEPGEAEASIGLEAGMPDAPTPSTLAPIELEDGSRQLECVIAVPLGLDERGMLVEMEGGVKKRLPFGRIEAIAVAAVEGLGDKPVLVMDLILNWAAQTREPLRAIRLRTDRFEPRQLVPDASDPLQALRVLAARLLQHTRATPLPDHQSVRGSPFAAFATLADYEARVLMVGD
jgi:membrane associated rhomboid family serine protease